MAKFVVFEGIDGSGKTTLIEEVRENLEKQGLRVGVLKSLLPDTEIGKSIRKWISIPSNRNKHLLIISQFTTGILEANLKLLDMINSDYYDIIISDRWLMSTYVYGLGDEINYEEYDACLKILSNTASIIQKMDYLVYTKCTPSIAIERIKARDKELSLDIFTSKEQLIDYSKKYDLYVDELRNSKNAEYLVVDADIDRNSTSSDVRQKYDRMVMAIVHNLFKLYKINQINLKKGM